MPHPSSRCGCPGGRRAGPGDSGHLAEQAPGRAARPVGVVGAITPWIFPLPRSAQEVTPALAAWLLVVLGLGKRISYGRELAWT